MRGDGVLRGLWGWNFFGRQHLTFDKGGKDVGVRRMMVRMRKRIGTYRC